MAVDGVVDGVVGPCEVAEHDLGVAALGDPLFHGEHFDPVVDVRAVGASRSDDDPVPAGDRVGEQGGGHPLGPGVHEGDHPVDDREEGHRPGGSVAA